MDKIARGFLIAAIVYGITGLLLGLYMAISQNHGQIPAHAHVNLIGWVSFFLFALFYQLLGTGVPRLLARLHFGLAQISAPGIFIGIGLIYAGYPEFEPVAAVSSMAYAASFVIFAVGAFISFKKQS
jgi:cbb3-type cytochrome oxidase subunit 1